MKKLVTDLDETLGRLRAEITERARVLRDILFKVTNSTYSGNTLSGFSGVVNADPVELAEKIAEYNARLVCRNAISKLVCPGNPDEDYDEASD